jgi:hypothetical protein
METGKRNREFHEREAWTGQAVNPTVLVYKGKENSGVTFKYVTH